MRNFGLRLLPVVAVGLVLGGILLALPGPRINRASYDRLQAGMTAAEVEAVIGAPAGNYYAGQVMDAEGELFYVEYNKGAPPAVTQRWVSNDTTIEVDYNAQGRLQYKGISPMERVDPTYFDLLRARLRAKFSW